MRRERAPLRAGYMGHLTEIANSLQAVAARRPAVARTLCSNAAWTDFAFGPLAERNQVPSQSFRQYSSCFAIRLADAPIRSTSRNSHAPRC